MRQLSKSKLIAYRQCPKRLWLELHKPELKDDSGSEMVFQIGHQVGELAQSIFDPQETGTNVDPNLIGWEDSAAQTQALLAAGDGPVFEAFIRIPGALALSDVMRPTRDLGSLQWEMIEVKSSTGAHDYHRDDVAIQTYIAHEAGIPLSRVGVAHVDNQFVYPGGGDYEGLLHIEDLTEEAKARHTEIQQWIEQAQSTAALEEEPEVEVGDHCTKPFTCGFCEYCWEDVPRPEDPFCMLPNLNPKRREAWKLAGFEKLDHVPEQELTSLQKRVRDSNLSGKTYFDAQLAKALLQEEVQPVYFLDFETVQFAVPIWKGTRPYQHLPFQYSLHRVDKTGSLDHFEFLNLEPESPIRKLAQQMLTDCGMEGTIYAYHSGFEKGVIKRLADQFEDLRDGLEALLPRIEDLLPIARRCYYNPLQGKSWGLKAITPAIAPDLSYENLQGVHVGSQAGPAYQEAILPGTTTERREELRQQMLAYCKLDTLATVKIWEFFKGT